MMPYTDYTVRLGDLKRAIMKNPYDPNLNIDGYMRYLKYNTPSAQPEIIRCNDCKHNPKETWFECPMADLSEKQRPDNAWCWKGERKEK